MKARLESSRRSQALLASALLLTAALTPQVSGQAPTYPILYVTQVPVTATSNTVVSVGGSHLADTRAAPRGGSLMIRYPDGTVKNLTQAAGYGIDGRAQVGNAIAVRDPMVHWSGERALFSMVVGAPVDAADTTKFHWQIYEIVGLGKDDTPVVTRIAGQRRDFNNIQPAYTSDDKLIFVSDQTLNGEPMVYPARNEQGGVSVTGLWSLDTLTMKVSLMDHSPSGSFKPFVDTYGRVVFSRWDHLQRDSVATTSNAVDYASEDPDSSATNLWSDLFPESLTNTSTTMGHKFDLFLPWTMNQDGTGLLTMNHLGRHELATAFGRARQDSNLVDFEPEVEPLTLEVNVPTRAGAYLHLAENPKAPGSYIATDAVSSAVSAGRLVTYSSPPDKNPDSVEVLLANNMGFARDPAYLSDGRLMGSFSEGPLLFGSYGSGGERGPVPPEFIPAKSSPFRIRIASRDVNLNQGSYLIPPTQVDRSNYVDGKLVNFSGFLWQLQPVEVLPRRVPVSDSIELPEPELKMFGEAGVSPSALRRWLEENEMALVVSRNVTTRDKNDRQQPFNLRVPGGPRSFADHGPSYEVTNLQFFQGDYVRGYKESGVLDPSAGRRIAPRILHDDKGKNISTDIAGSAKIASDGSTAMFLPAGRAVTWQLTDERGAPVVRERYWLTFQAGEIRSCANCHGTNTSDQLDRLSITNPPAALRTLLSDWNRRHPEAGASVTPYQFWAELNLSPGAPAEGDANSDGLSNLEAFAYGFEASSTITSDPLARPLTPSLSHTGDDDYLTLTFTLNLNATQLRVGVESSTDLGNWKEAAVLEGGTPTTNDGTVSVATSSSPELSARGLIQVVVQGLTPLANAPDTYFRLRFEEL